jgi:predicted ArsR family transcriptional regulator
MACSYDTLTDDQKRALHGLLSEWTTAPSVARTLSLPAPSARRMLLRMAKRGEADRKRAKKGTGEAGRGQPPWLYRMPPGSLLDDDSSDGQLAVTG